MPTSHALPAPESAREIRGCASCRSSIDLDRTQVLVFRRGAIVGVRCVFCETERSLSDVEPQESRADVFC